MKPIQNLDLGFSDAENYRSKSQRDLFNKIFVKNSFLDQLFEENRQFLVGEKGTGKTAYSVFLSSNNYRNTVSDLRYLRETDYQKFLVLKEEKQLALTEFASIWKVIILLLMAKSIREDEINNNIFTKRGKLKAVIEAIDDYYNHAFSPEIVNVLQFVENSKVAAELIAKYLKAGGESSTETHFSESRYQTNLLYIENSLKAALTGIKLKWNHFLFIDGIDIRPGSIPFPIYLECVKGLANAAWSLNQDFFSNIKDSTGRFKAIVLIRPDIFNSLGLQNASNKLSDNSVFLDWRTTYPAHRTSELFLLSSTLLSAQQKEIYLPSDCWDFYFGWPARSQTALSQESAFCEMLRISYSRPRDIVRILNLLQEEQKRTSSELAHFDSKVFYSDPFKNAYSQYLMGGVRDQLSFYYNETEYDIFLKFFHYLNGRIEFTYEEFLKAYSNYATVLEKARNAMPVFMGSADSFLQFLYDSNVICYMEFLDDKPYYSFCYRDRSASNASPKVKDGVTYRIHQGLHKELKVGYGAKTPSRNPIE